MQEPQTAPDTRVPIQSNTQTSIYDLGVKDLQQVAGDEGLNRRVESDFREARGRETARLHVTLKAVAESDRRAASNTRETVQSIERLMGELQTRSAELKHLVESFEATALQQFDGVHADLAARADALVAQTAAFSDSESSHFRAIQEQMAVFQKEIWNKSEANFTGIQSTAVEQFEATSTQLREGTEGLKFDVRETRDELVSLIDSRLNQADASFAALRGDVEVVKFLVMDLIKDRIGRHDPKNKPF